MNGIFTLNQEWFTELKRFARMTWSVMFGAMKVGWEVLRGQRKLFRRCSYRNQAIQDIVRAIPDGSGHYTTEDSDDEDRVDEAEEEIYQRFLRGEQVSDNEDDTEDKDFDSLEEDDETKEVEEDDDSEYELETVRLYADLANRESTPEASTALTMLTHMSYAGSSPLTRRRFGVLQRQASPREGDFDDPGLFKG